jgi:molecular chaperone DnaJ
MPEKKDYYEVLGVPKDSSEKDLKGAYRKLAMKYHPDRSEEPNAEEKFKELSEAYAVLSDPEKRQKYDQFGHAGINSQYSQEDLFRGVNFEDLLRGFGFGGGGGGEGIFDMFFGGGRGRGPSRGRDLRYDIDLTLEQAASGLETTIDVPRTESCPDCAGSGAKRGTSPVTCSNCRGSGQVTRAQSTPFGQIVTSAACSRCGGRGQIITNPCPECSGTGRVRKTRKINIKIPPGVDSEQHLKLRGQGDAAMPGSEAGDLYVIINVLPHAKFQRVNSDLLLEIPISITQATLGAGVEVPTLNGRARIKVPAGTQTGSVFRLRGKGMPRLPGPGSGDLHVKVKIKTPSALSERQRELMEALAAEFGEKRPAQSEKEKSFIGKIVDEVKSAVQ